MDFQTQKKSNAYFDPQKVMGTQILWESFVWSTKRLHQLALALGDGTKNTKPQEVILKSVEEVAQKLDINEKIEQGRCLMK